MQKLFCLLLLLGSTRLYGQELYVFSEPASNMPAHSLSVKQTAKGLKDRLTGINQSRHATELMLGVSKNLMVHLAGTFSDIYSPNIRWEGSRLYAKYRFYSNDALYSHFRMAAFGEASYSRNKPFFDELSLEGDQSGVQAGLIATQLLHKLAISSTVSLTKVLQDQKLAPLVPYASFNYSLSAGYLVLPKAYTDYKQTNLNLYAELIGQKATGQNKYFIDLAPAVQLIFNSTVKLNMGYRFQLGSNMNRMADKSWLISFEWLFLDVLK